MALHDLLSRTRQKPLSERQQRIHFFLDTHYIGVLSTVTPNNDPHGTVVYYVIDDDFTIWLLTKTRTHKYDNLKHNNHVMLTVFDADSQTTVQILGTAAEHSGNPDVTRVSNRIFTRLLFARDNQLPPIIKLQAGAFAAVAIKPASIRLAVYARPDPGDYDQLFESIESFEMPEV